MRASMGMVTALLAIGCGAAGVEGLPPASIDAAQEDRDAEAARLDAQSADAVPQHERDAADPHDAGPRGEPRILVTPPDTLVLGASGSRGAITIANVGAAELVLGPLTFQRHDSNDDFRVEGCADNPCLRANTRLCAPSEVGCTTSSTVVVIRYRNSNRSRSDITTLVIASDDGRSPEYPLVVSADNACPLPTAVIDVLRPLRPAEPMPVVLSGARSSPGGGPIVSYAWSFDFSSSSPLPSFTPTTPEGQTSFVATTPGVHIVALTVTNACGARSEPTNEVITVRP